MGRRGRRSRGDERTAGTVVVVVLWGRDGIPENCCRSVLTRISFHFAVLFCLSSSFIPSTAAAGWPLLFAPPPSTAPSLFCKADRQIKNQVQCRQWIRETKTVCCRSLCLPSTPLHLRILHRNAAVQCGKEQGEINCVFLTGLGAISPLKLLKLTWQWSNERSVGRRSIASWFLADVVAVLLPVSIRSPWVYFVLLYRGHAFIRRRRHMWESGTRRDRERG